MYKFYNKVKEVFFVNSNCWVNEHNLYNCEELIKQHEAAVNGKEISPEARKSVENAMQSGTPVAKKFLKKFEYDMIPPESKRGLEPEILLPFDKTYNGVGVPVPEGGPFYAVKWFV